VLILQDIASTTATHIL